MRGDTTARRRIVVAGLVLAAAVIAVLFAISLVTQRATIPAVVVPTLAPPADVATSTPAPTATAGAGVVTIEGIAFNEASGSIDVLASIDDDEAAGSTCRAVADDGSATAEASSVASPDARSARCAPIAVPAAGLHGDVAVTVEIGGVAAPPVVVEVP